METEIVDGMEIVYGDEIEISATKHISLSSAAYDIPEFVGESEGTEDITDKIPINFFDKLFTPEIIEEMVDQTNLYTSNRGFTLTLPKLLEKEDAYINRIL